MTSGCTSAVARRSVLVALAVAFAFGLPTTARAAGELWLKGAGATFPAPLYKRWIEAYEKGHPGTSLTYDAVGSGEGFNRFITGSVDFAGADPVKTADHFLCRGLCQSVKVKEAFCAHAGCVRGAPVPVLYITIFFRFFQVFWPQHRG